MSDVSVDLWFDQPDHPLGTAILLPGRRGGMATPLLHWSAALLTELGWSVLGVTWAVDRLAEEDASVYVRRCAEAALAQAPADRPVFVVAKSLGTLALPWAVEKWLPGAWLTPLLSEPAVVAAVQRTQQPTLLVGGTSDPFWLPPAIAGAMTTVLELPDADHGLHLTGDWRRSLLQQVDVFDRISQLAQQVLHSTSQ
jgi:predicted alpha/beta-hydrolase family hydrolase